LEFNKKKQKTKNKHNQQQYKNNTKRPQKHHTVGTVEKYARKTVGRGKIDTLKHKYMTDY